MPLLDMYGKPIDISRRAALASRDSGAIRGDVFSGWLGPQQHSEDQAARERKVMQRRAADLAANDWAAESALSAIGHNAIGTGLRPHAQLPADELGITREQAITLGKRMEWLFYAWSRTAGSAGQTFEELQFLALRTMLVMGEAVHVPAMMDEVARAASGARFALYLQPVSPVRMRTPMAFLADPAVIDGVRLSSSGTPLAYYIACPPADGGAAMVTEYEEAMEYRAIPARIAHRPGMLHLFVRREDEQVRGVSAFSNSMRLFRLLDDSLAYELLAQTMASKFPVFISRTTSLADTLPQEVTDTGGEAEARYQSYLDGPEFLYGNPGEEPKVLESNRPSANFLSFVRTVLNAIASSVGLPYIALAKDFENVNYSSARAALNESWRLYQWYRQFFASRYCQPVWEMLFEEAWLRGEIVLPAGSPDFYEARELWTACAWNGPARGYMDPIKEIQADVMAIDNKLMSRHEAMASAGRDFEDEYPTLIEEAERMKALQSSGSSEE